MFTITIANILILINKLNKNHFVYYHRWLNGSEEVYSDCTSACSDILSFATLLQC